MKPQPGTHHERARSKNLKRIEDQSTVAPPSRKNRRGSAQRALDDPGRLRLNVQARLDSLAHRHVLGQLIQFLAISGTFSFFGGKWFDAPHMRAKPVFQFFHTCR
jgi:hypothetical protein